MVMTGDSALELLLPADAIPAPLSLAIAGGAALVWKLLMFVLSVETRAGGLCADARVPSEAKRES